MSQTTGDGLTEALGLIIRDPYAQLIVTGCKIWELRKTRTSHRGLIFIIEAGTSNVLGFAQLKDVIPLTKDIYDKNAWKHQVKIPYESCPWNKYAWVLDGAHLFRPPFQYDHPRGAITWVKLNHDNIHGIDGFERMIRETYKVMNGGQSDNVQDTTNLHYVFQCNHQST